MKKEILIAYIILLIFITTATYAIKNSKLVENDCIDKDETVNNGSKINEEKEISTNRYGANIENGPFRLNNNLWGLTGEEKDTKVVKSYIYYKFNGNFGWEWDRPDPRPNYNYDSDKYITPIYPEVMIGAAPNVNSIYSTTPYLPIRLENISSMTADIEYKYVKIPTEGYNLAYDIWIIDTSKIQRAEIMIWIQGDLYNSDIDGNAADGNNDYKFYIGPTDSNRYWKYYAFVLRNQDPVLSNQTILKHTVDIKILLDKLVQEGFLKREWIIPSMGIGNEIWKGSGKIEINKLKININGNTV